MISNNNLNPLPWYDSLDQQDHRKWYANGEIFSLATPRTNLLPFQVRRRKGETLAQLTVTLHNCEGVLLKDITADMNASGLTVESVNQYFENIIYRANTIFEQLLDIGFYYAMMTDGINTWYSEVFRVVSNLGDFIELEYWSVENQDYESGGGTVIYKTGYRNKLYIDSTLTRPKYENEDEGKKRDGFIFTEKKTSKKIFTFNFFAPEYLVDALRLPYLADFVRLTYKGDTYKIFDFSSSPTWSENGYGHYAEVVAEVECDTILKKIQLASSYTQDIVIMGRILDKDTRQPLSGANIELRYPSEETILANVVSDNNGYFMYRWFITAGDYSQEPIVAKISKNDYSVEIRRKEEPYLYAVQNGIQFGDILTESIISNWILRNGVWDDSAEWRDVAYWKDDINTQPLPTPEPEPTPRPPIGTINELVDIHYFSSDKSKKVALFHFGTRLVGGKVEPLHLDKNLDDYAKSKLDNGTIEVKIL